MVVGGVIAALANAGLSSYTGNQQISLETNKHKNDLDSEEYKAEASRISEAIKSPDQVHNACQLNFLLKLGLITNEILKSRVNQFLHDEKGANIPGTESTNTADPTKKNGYTPICTIATTSPTNDSPNAVDTKVTPPSNLTDSPRAKKVLIQSLTFSTGWIDGGHSQSEACSQAIANYQPQYPGKILESTGASEDVRKDFLGHVTYNYRCTVNVFDVLAPKR